MNRMLSLLGLALMGCATVSQPSGEGNQQEALETTLRTEEITIVSDTETTLAGTLTLPAEPTETLAILITGSGPQNRDEELMGFRPFATIAEALADKGIATFRYDDRGVGDSTGDFSTATTEDFAKDASAVLSFFRSSEDYNFSKIGHIGHSEGTLIAYLGSLNATPDFIVSLGGPAVPGKDVMLLQNQAIMSANGFPDEQIDSINAVNEGLYQAVIDSPVFPEEELRKQMLDLGMPTNEIDQVLRVLGSPWMIFFLAHDPLPPILQYEGPSLFYFGDLDLQVLPDQSVPVLEEAIGENDITIKIWEGKNHLFQDALTGAPQEYPSLEEPFPLDVTDDLATWILEAVES